MTDPRNHCSTRCKATVLLMVVTCVCAAANAQRPPVQVQPQNPPGGLTVEVSVRDSRGMPLEHPAMVHLYASVEGFNMRVGTQEGSTAVFHNVKAGEYEVEITCSGFKVTNEHVSVHGLGGEFHTYVYIEREEEASATNRPPSGVVRSPKLQNEIDKGLEAMRRHQYEVAKTHFLAARKIGPTSSDAAYLLGTAELGLQQNDLARKEFAAALTIEPSYDRALLALGELELQDGNAARAVELLEKAYATNGAGWRTHFLLAEAYARTGQLEKAENHAERAVSLAQGKAASALFLLGEIQNAEGNREAARKTWEQIITQYPGDPVGQKAKQKLASAKERSPEVKIASAAESFPMPVDSVSLVQPAAEQPWAPPDIDSKEYAVASNAPCQLEEVLAHALQRMTSQMENFEKFTATERIEHQEINKYGVPGAMRAREFNYIVFVHKLEPDSFYLDEDRRSADGDMSFPTSLATTGLNGMGVAILQPYHQKTLSFQCEGLVNVRDQAAWQIRFEERPGSAHSIREWRKDKGVYHLPVKGRVWIAASRYDVVRIETDLQAPHADLELNLDHILIDYGPVNFQMGKTTLWLPWSAEMYLELHRKRYHHRYFLTDYRLFSVETPHKIGKPKEAAEGINETTGPNK